jgi:biotin operon repressor
MEGMSKTRNMKNGSWYWIDKAVIYDYVPKIGSRGLVVYSFLASLADKNQRCFPSQKYIAGKLGCSRSTVNKAVKVLAKYGLIKIVRKNRYHCTYLLLKVRCKAGETQMSHPGNSDVSQMNTNDNKRIININNIDKEKSWRANFNSSKMFTQRTSKESLAVELARDLDDDQGLPFYISLVKKYPESFLREILGQVKEIPQAKIKKSRGALFNNLVQRNGGKPFCT